MTYSKSYLTKIAHGRPRLGGLVSSRPLLSRRLAGILGPLFFLMTLTIPGSAAGSDIFDGMRFYKQGEYRQAYRIFLELAEDGALHAQNYLGVMFAKGQGVKQDYFKSVYWYGRAAVQGYPEAQFRLGSMFATGHGVSQNYVRAYAWAYLSANQGHAKANGALNLLNTYLTPAQITEAKVLSKQYVKDPAKHCPYCLDNLKPKQ